MEVFSSFAREMSTLLSICVVIPELKRSHLSVQQIY